MTELREATPLGERASWRAARQKAVAGAVGAMGAINTQKGEGHALPGGLQHHLVLGPPGARRPCPCGLGVRGSELLLSLKCLLPCAVLKNIQVTYGQRHGPLGAASGGRPSVCPGAFS